MEPAIELRDVRKSYGKFVAVDGVSLTVPRGSIFGLLGPNGAGKTSTIRMLMNITAPDAGEVLLFGSPRSPEDDRRIGYLPEERGLYGKMTVIDQLLFLAELRGVRRRDARPRAYEWLERVQLADWAKKKVEELSKGMQQKVQLVSTLFHEPELVVLDEPFSGLDPINQGLFKELLIDYRARNRSILFSTHIMEHAEKLCDRIALISKGQTVLTGEIREVKRRYGGNCYRLVGEGDLAGLASLDEVDDVRLLEDGAAQLFLTRGFEPARALERIVRTVAVSEFRSEEPDLEEIFIRAVGGDRGEEAA